jgi:hypothetical protein
MPLPSAPTDDELFSRVEAWIDRLAQGDFEAAFAYTEHDAYYAWTPALLREVIQGYGLPGRNKGQRSYEVTPRLAATGGPRTREVDREAKPAHAIAIVRYNLPLNGAWSDLTSTFRVERRGEESVMVLEEVHVF